MQLLLWSECQDRIMEQAAANRVHGKVSGKLGTAEGLRVYFVRLAFAGRNTVLVR